MPAKLSRMASSALLAAFAVTSLTQAATTAPAPKPAPPALVASTLNASVTIPAELRLDRFAGESQVQNPTAISIDPQGRIFVAETHRWRLQIHDNRNVPIRDFRNTHGEWLMDDLACRTTADREAMLKRWADGGRFTDISNFAHFSADAEKIRLLVDRDGDGKADTNAFFSERFNAPTAGTAGGIMVWDDAVYFACIPEISVLNDRNRDGKPDDYAVIQEGFGVRTSISGHDLNGFAIGPDRRLYWTVGDRGFNFTTKEGRKLEGVGKGGTFRCELDGSDLQLFCDGLRNPKEIAFDDFGNLFTVDNNADMGDEARVYYLMPGADYGWRMGHQVAGGQTRWVFGNESLETPCVWMEEGIWELPFASQPEYVQPPVSYLTSGPCGFTANPGVVALSETYKNEFFVVDYRGAPAKSGLFAFSLAPKGARFEMKNARPIVQGLALTDIEFGYDGKLYMSDYIGGWGMTDKGQILALYDPDLEGSWKLGSLQRLAKKSFPEMSSRSLAKLLSHPDRRIRLRAQFALSDKPDAYSYLQQAATDHRADIFTRLHGTWGLAWLARHGNEAAQLTLLSLLGDKDDRVRAQAVRSFGDLPDMAQARAAMVKMLTDNSDYVKSLAAIALGQVAEKSAFAAAQELLTAAETADPSLRYAATYVLERCGSPEQIAALASNPEPRVRHAAVVALRDLASPLLANFLKDADHDIVREAARAIYDENIVKAYPQLAALADSLVPFGLEPLPGYRGSADITPEERERRLERQFHRRVLYANWHVASISAAKALITYAHNAEMMPLVRLEALNCLDTWGQPHALDRVVADLRPLPARGTDGIYAAILPDLEKLVADADGRVLAKAVAMSPKIGYTVPTDRLYQLMMDPTMESEARARACEEWQKRSPKDLELTYMTLLADSDEWLFSKGLEGIIKLRPELAANIIRLVAYSPKSTDSRRQLVVSRLEKLLPAQRDPLVVDAMKALQDGTLPGPIQLETTTVATAIAPITPPVSTLLADWQKTAATEPLGQFAVALDGGNPQKGREIFEEHAAAQCTKCHSLYGNGGKAAPDLGGIGAREKPEYILESIVNPAAKVATGWGIVTVTTTTGNILTGTLTVETDDSLTIRAGESETVVKRAEIASQQGPFSAMPPMAILMATDEIRNLVAFLRQQREPLKQEGH